MTDRIIFSIVIPTYNRAHLISRTIESILAQTFRDFEVIIVDDGSTDNTEEVIRKYLSDRVYYYKKKNEERAAARNFGALKAKGDYINCFDSDDIMFTDHLAAAYETMTKFDRPELFTQGFQYQDEKGHVFFKSHYSSDINHDMYKGNQVVVCSVFVRKDIAIANPYNTDRDLSGSEDFELWLRLSAKYKMYSSDHITVAFIHHMERSIIAMKDPGQLIRRYTKFIEYTTANKEVVALMGKNKDVFVMKNYLLLAVDLVNNNFKSLGMKYLRLAAASSPEIIFERGFYAFIKHYLRHLFS